ncbi:Precorrin-6Y C(5,15)-methyltransferase [Bradyrhizobium sp. ORS 285]|uniref:bifunctional cobalt-precorrin-7 (C(5))-methyltransferase/cobalt-precorrin-6B (C(15))-methyltransferase n=1 Tax=Bradyrhizobium sp. ORS 285 TaxID=115808 RepID=UPI000240AB5D|nr:bifunctional cobalt-precorrin-7 (C(5))-methyltransferase/cobalt-precorrin-6B (C(15))-methyltransferase [Bradyrhizobium sp. ORS 285]CCD85295.1 Precorrin-6Y C(5,15)-methyltransferase [Bradyrhizobium sp. ORS 285]SMX57454.1 Precorrin-6Y C(5,15)-methyltransferase [Bradyrhizobium sp. ORS 285]
MVSPSATCNATRWLSIVGIGEDGIDGLTAHARRLIAQAALVVGGARHLDLAAPLVSGQRLAWPSPLQLAFEQIAARSGEPVVVLASGDPFNYGVGKQLMQRFDVGEMLCVPQPSAFSLAAARLGWSLQDVAQVTLHGRALEGIIRHLSPGARILALAWDGSTAAKLAALLTSRRMGRSRLTVLEAMGGPQERVRSALAEAFDLTDIHPLTTIALDVEADVAAPLIPLSSGLADDLFEHDGQLTKRDVRAVTLAALAPRPGELLWDVGLGSGSVAIEWLLRHGSLRAIGIEARQERADRALRNALALGTPDLKLVLGRAPAVLADLESPDAAFIGGGISEPAVFDAVWSKLKPGGRLVANVISLEGEARLIDLFGKHGGELVRIAVSRIEPVGRMHGWRSAMPVTQWRVTKS